MDWMFVAGGSVFVAGVLLWLAGGAWGRHQRTKNARRFGPQ